MFSMRRHMVLRHGMTKEQVDRVTNKRPRWPYHVGQGNTVQAYAETTGLLADEGSSAFAAPPRTEDSEL